MDRAGTEEESEKLTRGADGDAFQTENRTGSEVLPCGAGQRDRPDTDGPLKTVSGTRWYVLTSEGREITTALLAERQADVDQLAKVAA